MPHLCTFPHQEKMLRVLCTGDQDLWYGANDLTDYRSDSEGLIASQNHCHAWIAT